jgi:endo-1,4-beta-mannosidase
MGFKTVRVFCSQPEVYRDPARCASYYAAMDRMLDLCDRHGLRVVFCLGANDGSYAKARGETFREFVARPGAKSRGDFEAYVRDMVTRYRDRRTIALWEHANELLLMADIGGKGRVWNGVTVPDLAEVARFHADLAATIRALDPRHLITTGDSFRFSQWHLYRAATGDEKDMWGRDTLEQLGRALTMSQKGVDVFCVHYYGFGVKGENQVAGAGGRPVVCLPADLKRVATAAGQPFYLGEYGLQAVPRDEKNRRFWSDNPDWFTGFEADRARAERAVVASLKVVVNARASLTHWWCYQSDRDMDRDNPQRFDIDLRRTPRLVRLVAAANRALQQATMGFTYVKDDAVK